MLDRFVTFEGCDGAGKTVQARRLVERLKMIGEKAVYVREPGGCENAEKIRDLLVHKSQRDAWHPLSVFHMMFAARVENLFNTILPYLRKGYWVICDRFVDSTRVYQCMLGNLDKSETQTIIENFLNDYKPCVTFLIDVDTKVAAERLFARCEFEELCLDYYLYLDNSRQAFLSLVKEEPERFIVVDGSMDEDELEELIFNKLFSHTGLGNK